MTSERLQRMEEVFAEAAAASGADRLEILRRRCAGDDSLRRDVQKLLAAHDNGGDLLEQPPTGHIERITDEGGRDRGVGRRFGAYEAVERIGAGGMGAVYLGRRRDEQFDKQVAIKVIHWWMDTAEILRRFERERRVLAQLQHPNIAMLLDAGADEDGAPFIVMEYVDGVPIDRYCADRSISIDERLRLFLSACDAVEAAHRNLVVHLDLKPSNILVTSDGLVKLVDFGIARVLDHGDRSALRTNARVFTPAYAAPEQIAGEPLTIATDVYALGVVLYELLTGERPFQTGTDPALGGRDAALSTPPTRPSVVVATTTSGDSGQRERRRLARRIQGDLDNIALMAMRKEPARRYASVQTFSEDIRRHLSGRTVAARPDTLGYRTSRFVRRNRISVGAAAVVFLSLLVGVAAFGWQARIASMQRDRAEQRFADLRGLTNSLIAEVDRDLAEIPGATEVRRAVVTQAMSHLDSLVAEVVDEPELLAELASSYSQLGALHRNFIGSDLGDTAVALESHQKALDLRLRVLEMKPGDPEAVEVIGESHLRIGDMMRAQGDLDAAVEHYRKSGEFYASMRPGTETLRLDRDHNIAVVNMKLGIVQSMRGEYGKAARAYEASLKANAAILEGDPSLTVTRRNMAVGYEKLGDIAEARGDAEAALEHYKRSLAMLQDLERREPGEARHILSIAIAHSKIGEALGHPAYANLGDVEGAMKEYRTGRRVIGELLRVDPANARARMIASFFDRRLGAFLAMTGAFDEALEHQQAAMEAAEALAAANPSDVRALSDVASCAKAIAETRAAMGDPEEALQSAIRAIEAHMVVLDVNDELVSVRVELADAFRDAGECCIELARVAQSNAEREARLDQARDWIRQCVEAYAALEQRGQLRSATIDAHREARRRLEELERAPEAATFTATPG